MSSWPSNRAVASARASSSRGRSGTTVDCGLAPAPRLVPRSVPAIAALRAAGREEERVYDDLVVLPNQVEVVLPVPGEPGATPTEPLLTMTSCHPEFSSRQRWVTHARLERVLDRTGGLPAELLEVTG